MRRTEEVRTHADESCLLHTCTYIRHVDMIHGWKSELTALGPVRRSSFFLCGRLKNLQRLTAHSSS